MKTLSVTIRTLTLLICGGLHMYTMVYFRVVSTKLTEEEHSRLIDICNVVGCSPSYLIKDAILRMINVEQKTTQREPNLLQTLSKELNMKPRRESKEFPSIEFAKFLER